MSHQALRHGDYAVGWICALPKEMTVAMAMLDTIHERLPQSASDCNNYCLGSIGRTNIAIAGLPSGEIGTQPASAVVIRMLASFPNVRLGLMVGIGGGVPSKENDIRLGDVVVSIPAHGYGGVVQHDMGKSTQNGGWVRTGSLNGPPSVLRTTITKLRSLHQLGKSNINSYLMEMLDRHPGLSPQFVRQESFQDILYEPEPEDSEACSDWIEIQRVPRKPSESIKVHYGLVASGNQVIKSGRQRDAISARLGGVSCFEMEAAGLMNELSSVVIRGICDYCDAHKNKEWQEHAAAVAAAYAKELILALPLNINEEAETAQHTHRRSTALSDDIQIPQLATGPHWIVPFPRNKRFVGRQQELSTLRQWSLSRNVCSNMAVCGLGGVGKTQIALEFAFCTREQNPTCSVFWVPATDHLSFERAYKQIGRALHVPGIDADGADFKELVKDALSNDARIGRWLMIVDNADDMDMVFRQTLDSEVSSTALIDYIPFCVNGSVLLTTRNRKVAVKQAADQIIILEIMGAEEARKLLANSVLQQAILRDIKSSEELLRLLGYLPLAIIQAAAYINENDTTLHEYLSLYNDSETEVMKVLSEEFELHGRYKGTKNSISTTWLISLNQLTRTSPVAIDYLSFMACLSNQNISQSLLPPAPSKKEGLEAVGALKAYSLINKRADGSDCFDIHPLVHLATRNWLRSEGRLLSWTANAVSRLVDLLPDGGYMDRGTWSVYLPHAIILLASDPLLGSDDDLRRIVLAEKLGKCLYSNGEYSKAHQAYEQAVELRVKACGPDNRDALRNMFGVAESLNHQGKYKQAEIQHSKVLELRQRVLGPKDPEVGRSMNYLAQSMYDGGRYAESEEMHRNALRLQKEILPPEHPNILTTIGYLAQTLGKQGKFAEAIEMHRDLLATRLRVQGETYPGTLATMSCLGVAQGDLGYWAEAEETHRRVLFHRLRVLGHRHPHTLITMRWLAHALVHQGKGDEALAINKEALRAQIELLGLKHPNTLLTLGSLGDILALQGLNSRAVKVYQQALQLNIDVHGLTHPETLNIICLLKRLEKPAREAY